MATERVKQNSAAAPCSHVGGTAPAAPWPGLPWRRLALDKDPLPCREDLVSGPELPGDSDAGPVLVRVGRDSDQHLDETEGQARQRPLRLPLTDGQWGCPGQG